MLLRSCVCKPVFHRARVSTLFIALSALSSSFPVPSYAYKMSTEVDSTGIQSMPGADKIQNAPEDFKEPALENPRKVVQSVESRWQGEGQGARVRRSIGRPELKNLDPFLMLDEFYVGKPAGFPDHPHRGFETVTYILKGSFTHEDFAGHKGTINPGDLQWMTAGKGIVHSEVPASDDKAHGMQLWVNLASEHKMVDPHYQELTAGEIPKVMYKNVVANVIAGEAFGIESPVYTRTPTMYLDFRMEPNTEVKQKIPKGWNGFMYMLSGGGTVEGVDAPAHHTLVLSNKGDEDGIHVKAGGQGAHFVLICGQPLNEPVVQHGPFVMNTKEEIYQAMKDYQEGKNGFERARHWQSSTIDQF
eukprot:gb/GECG01010530.1/.p1 GENE.gb/GECG01010530.1/~~gb/GECG01010530.1/.p1  ORF type:complete len:359 (+),score=45.72 gb/GECG01010530.1/:1-1077(+)